MSTKHSAATRRPAAKATSGSSDSSSIKRWTSDEDKSLKTLIKQNTPTRLIAMKLKRTEGSVRQHVGKLGLSLKPANRAPYG
jgi:hypothetical protein